MHNALIQVTCRSARRASKWRSQCLHSKSLASESFSSLTLLWSTRKMYDSGSNEDDYIVSIHTGCYFYGMENDGYDGLCSSWNIQLASLMRLRWPKYECVRRQSRLLKQSYLPFLLFVLSHVSCLLPTRRSFVCHTCNEFHYINERMPVESN